MYVKPKPKQFVHTSSSELVVFMYWTGKSMNNLLSNCGLLDPRISASDKDLPMLNNPYYVVKWECAFTFFFALTHLRPLGPKSGNLIMIFPDLQSIKKEEKERKEKEEKT